MPLDLRFGHDGFNRGIGRAFCRSARVSPLDVVETGGRHEVHAIEVEAK